MNGFSNRTIVRASLIALAVLVCVIGGVLYHRWSGADSSTAVEDSEQDVPQVARASQPPVQQPVKPDPSTGCAVFGRGSASVASSTFVQSARALSQEKRFDEALWKYRDLASLDPAFPGVNLNISLTLSKLKQPEAAQEAIQAQLAASECLTRMSADALAAYCRSEGFTSTSMCMKELASIKQATYYQAAMVDTSLTQKGNTGPERAFSGRPVLESSGLARSQTRQPSSKSSEAFLAKAAVEHPVKPKSAKAASGGALASGSGTDAALGAYSK